MLFAQTPTYQDLISRTVSLAPYFELIDDDKTPNPATVTREGVEPSLREWKSLVLPIDERAKLSLAEPELSSGPSGLQPLFYLKAGFKLKDRRS